MASVSYSEDLTCPICLSFFSDPVNLPCAHSFCRECITLFVSSRPHCPQCRESVPPDVKSLPSSFLLKSLTEKAREAEKIQAQRGLEKPGIAELCPEHEEKLKLFCVTDQQLACIICRDGEKHEGHKFKPIKEAAQLLRQELEKAVEKLFGDITSTESVANKQREEITKTEGKSQQLMAQICRQFEEMHQFLRKREDEIKSDLKRKEEAAVENMSKMLKSVETASTESNKLLGKVTSLLEIKESEKLLEVWVKESSMKTPEELFRPIQKGFTVVNSSLSLGPYGSHLQFFMWKEMLQVVQPRAEKLTLRSKTAEIIVSDDGRSLRCCAEYATNMYGHNGYRRRFAMGNIPQNPDLCSTHQACSINEFTSGQHYWEIEVGGRKYWEVGVKDGLLIYDGQKYAVCSANIITGFKLQGRPGKIGIYLDFLSKKLSFYDADRMTLIHMMSSKLQTTPLPAHFALKATAQDPNPLTVCWY